MKKVPTFLFQYVKEQAYSESDAALSKKNRQQCPRKIPSLPSWIFQIHAEGSKGVAVVPPPGQCLPSSVIATVVSH